MTDLIMKFFNQLPILNKPLWGNRPNPATALVLGLLLGGVGLGIYLKSWIDFLIPVVVVLLLSVKWTGGIAFGAAIAALWGLLRVLNSNQRLDKGEIK